MEERANSNQEKSHSDEDISHRKMFENQNNYMEAGTVADLDLLCMDILNLEIVIVMHVVHKNELT